MRRSAVVRRTPAASVITRLLLCCASALIVVLTTGAAALAQDWDPQAFVELLEGGEADYRAGNYASAGQKYGKARAMLSGALTTGAIGAEQEPAARQTLATVTYQLGRSQHETGDCDAAQRTFGELARTSSLDDAIRVKLPARQGEAELCAARQHLSAGDLDATARSLGDARSALDKADTGEIASVLDARQASELEGALNQARADIDSVEARYAEARGEAARAAIASGECDVATSHIDALEPGDDTTALRAELEDCEAPGTTASGDGSFEEIEPWIAVGVMGVGGALVVTAIVLEAINASDVDDYETARDDCLVGLTSECQRALDLSDDIETQQIVTGTLVGVGVVAIGGGLAWYLLSALDDDDAPSSEGDVEMGASILPGGGGVDVLVRF